MRLKVSATMTRGGPGADAIHGGAGDDRRFRQQRRRFIAGSLALFADDLTGSARNEVLSGHAGNDHLLGLAGDDWLDGGDGLNDVGRGGVGRDDCQDVERPRSCFAEFTGDG